MSHANTKAEQDRQAASRSADAKAKAAEEKKPADPMLMLALLATDWCHNDRHHAAQIQAMAIEMLDELGGVDAEGNAPPEPTEDQEVALLARGRLEGAANITTAPVPPARPPAPVTTQPARHADEQRAGQPQTAQQPHGA